ncbi:MAG: GNAT family N-acetyltransferase [Rufibacter sp.]
MTLHYQTGIIPSAAQIIDLYQSAGLNRPLQDAARIEKMFAHSNLVITAWDGELLVGVSRSLTDGCWSCYLADLAVREDYKKSGIGKKLIDLTKEAVGKETMVLLLSAPGAMAYYPKVGFEIVTNGFILPREF